MQRLQFWPNSYLDKMLAIVSRQKTSQTRWTSQWEIDPSIPIIMYTLATFGADLTVLYFLLCNLFKLKNSQYQYSFYAHNTFLYLQTYCLEIAKCTKEYVHASNIFISSLIKFLYTSFLSIVLKIQWKNKTKQ